MGGGIPLTRSLSVPLLLDHLKATKNPAKTVSHLNITSTSTYILMQSVADLTVQGVEGTTSAFENGASGGGHKSVEIWRHSTFQILY